MQLYLYKNMVAQDQYYKDSEVELNISCIFSEINGAVLFTFYSYLKNRVQLKYFLRIVLVCKLVSI